MRNSHSHSLFHYTKTVEALSSILWEGFRVSYSGEQITDKIFIAIPMVSFCDIPLECCEEHRGKYGSYAIGINKKWMIKTYGDLLSPVHYVLGDESIRGAWKHHENYLKAIDAFKRYEERKEAEGLEKIKITAREGIVYEGYPSKLNSREDYMVLLSMNDLLYARDYANYALGITKNYTCKHKGKDVCTYDECEWRILIPEDRTVDDKISRWFWTEGEYSQWRSRRKNSFLDGFTIGIEPESVDSIVIQEESDRSTILTVLEDFGNQMLAEKITVLEI